ncbi:MAG: HAD-IIA family hydrolase [Micrococcaceae bacterium]
MSALISSYDAVFFDLDGVIYEGNEPLDTAVATLQQLYQDKVKIAYITNNASRSAHDVAEQLKNFGIPASAQEVISSPDVAMNMLKKHLAPASKVLIVGTQHLSDCVAETGFTPVRTAKEKPDAVLQGFNPETNWRILAEACFALQQGAQWFATNADSTLPQAEGIAPGNGAFLDLIQKTCNVAAPRVAGKPEPEIFKYAMEKIAAKNPVMIGDRLDTDILGGNNAGIDTILVTTGVNTAADARAAEPDLKPNYIISTLSELLSDAAS